MIVYRFAVAGCIAALTLLCGGCGKAPPPPIVPVEGIILLNGAPLPQAQVRFIPHIEFGPEYIATGVTDDAGRFTLRCNGQDGACVAAHTVVVADADIPPRLQSENAQRELAAYLKSLKNRPIPPNYATPVNTPLKVTVSEGQQEYKLELTR